MNKLKRTLVKFLLGVTYFLKWLLLQDLKREAKRLKRISRKL